jgi:dephospho-CoA kinase
MATLLVALTGGIASGKTTVATIFESLGAVVIDSDQIARDVVLPGTPGASKVRESFGDGVFNGDILNRSSLAAIVFDDESKRKLLESILHPLIQQRSKELFSSSEGVVIYQIPLLVESGHSYSFDAVITVEAENDTRIQRLIEHRSMSQSEASARIASQADRASREQHADFVIDSDCTLLELERQVGDVWGKLVEMNNRKIGFS